MVEGKLIKLTLEYEDETLYLEGEEAQKWLSATDGMAVLSYVHGSPFPQFNWKKKKPANAKQ